MIAEPWATIEKVAQHLGIVKDMVYCWRESKGLPAHKVGHLWKFQLSEAGEWVRAGGADEGPGKQRQRHMKELNVIDSRPLGGHMMLQDPKYTEGTECQFQ